MKRGTHGLCLRNCTPNILANLDTFPSFTWPPVGSDRLQTLKEDAHCVPVLPREGESEDSTICGYPHVTYLLAPSAAPEWQRTAFSEEPARSCSEFSAPLPLHNRRYLHPLDPWRRSWERKPGCLTLKPAAVLDLLCLCSLSSGSGPHQHQFGQFPSHWGTKHPETAGHCPCRQPSKSVPRVFLQQVSSWLWCSLQNLLLGNKSKTDV